MKDSKPLHYDKASRIYDVSREADSETIQKLLRLLQVDCDSVLLDMGCGTGNYTAPLQQTAKSVMGIDVSIGMIEQARDKSPALPFICGDVTSLPFRSETFDGAFGIQVLHHVQKKEIFLIEARRVLRKGAQIAIHSCSHKQMQAFWFYHYFPKGLEADLARIPDSGEIASLVERAGFSEVGIEICYHDAVVVREGPESYLDKNYRNSISTFSLLTEEEIQVGCARLQDDIASGAVDKIVRQSRAKVANDVGGSSIIHGRKD